MKQFLEQLHRYIRRSGIMEFEDHRIGGRTTQYGVLQNYDTYFIKGAMGNRVCLFKGFYRVSGIY